MWGANLRQHTKPWVRARSSRSYWETLNPASGRPYSPALSKPATGWAYTAGQDDMQQYNEMTTKEELENNMKKAQLNA